MKVITSVLSYPGAQGSVSRPSSAVHKFIMTIARQLLQVIGNLWPMEARAVSARSLVTLITFDIGNKPALPTDGSSTLWAVRLQLVASSFIVAAVTQIRTSLSLIAALIAACRCCRCGAWRDGCSRASGRWPMITRRRS